MSKGLKVLKDEPDYFPSVRLTIKDLPAIEDWPLGDYYIAAKVSLTEKTRKGGTLDFKEVAEITDEQAESL